MAYQHTWTTHVLGIISASSVEGVRGDTSAAGFFKNLLGRQQMISREALELVQSTGGVVNTETQRAVDSYASNSAVVNPAR